MAAEPIPDMDDIPSVARRAIQAGLRVVPPKEDGTKRPETELVDGEFSWKHWQTTPPSREQLRAWFGPKHGLGILTGSASGGVELFEFDDGETFDDFLSAAIGADLHHLTSRIMDGYYEETPGGGIHLLYRCSEVGGNEKLARYQVEVEGRREVHPLIETRGEGGYAVLAPSHGPVHLTGKPYRLLAGGVESIVTITPEERRLLFQLAHTFDRLPKEEFRGTNEPTAGGNAARPGDDFNARASWGEVLEPHGWQRIHTKGEITRWRRPEKDIGVSATTNWQGSDLLYVFSTSTPFEAERGYSKWRAYAILNHGGDFAAAARELARQGYGERKRPSLTVVAPVGGGDADDEAGQPAPRFALTDTGNAERLVHWYESDLRYCAMWSKWLVWDDVRWQVDSLALVEQRAKATVRRIVSDEAPGIKDPEQYKATLKWAIASENDTRRRAMIRQAQSEPSVAVLPESFDIDQWLVATENGTLDLRLGELRPHCREDLITRRLPVPYDPDATCPVFLAFLEQITHDPTTDRPRPELVDFLRRAVGYSLTGATSERAMFILYGVGANGKSTFLDIVRRLLGDYSMRVPTDTLMAKRNESIPNDIARLKGTRFVFAAETDEGRRLSEALIKDLTGGDTISARFMRGEWFDFRPEFKLWLATNHRPEIRGTDNAIWDRIRLIPFDVRIPEAQQDRSLPMKLEAEMPGILAWAVGGCLAWQAEGLKAPEAVRLATASYRSDMDALAAWLEDASELHPTATATANDLYHSYKTWCESSGERPMSKKRLGQRLGERGLVMSRKHGGVRIWVGLRLVTHSASVTHGDTLFPINAYEEISLETNRETASKHLHTSPRVTSPQSAPLPLNEEDDDEPDF